MCGHQSYFSGELRPGRLSQIYKNFQARESTKKRQEEKALITKAVIAAGALSPTAAVGVVSPSPVRTAHAGDSVAGVKRKAKPAAVPSSPKKPTVAVTGSPRKPIASVKMAASPRAPPLTMKLEDGDGEPLTPVVLVPGYEVVGTTPVDSMLE
jgi:hypothetical protein